MSSIIDRWSDARTVVREIATADGVVWARVRAPTSGELISAGASGALEPRSRGKVASGAVDAATATRQAEALVCVCTLAIGESPESMEPVTLCLTEGERPRSGTRPVPLYVLPAEVVAGLVTIAFSLFSPEANRAKTAAFPAG